MREETLLNIFRQLNEENQYILIAEADSLRTAQKLQEEHLKPEKGKNIIKLPKNRGGGRKRAYQGSFFYGRILSILFFYIFISIDFPFTAVIFVYLMLKIGKNVLII